LLTWLREKHKSSPPSFLWLREKHKSTAPLSVRLLSHLRTHSGQCGAKEEKKEARSNKLLRLSSFFHEKKRAARLLPSVFPLCMITSSLNQSLGSCPHSRRLHGGGRPPHVPSSCKSKCCERQGCHPVPPPVCVKGLPVQVLKDAQSVRLLRRKEIQQPNE